MKPVIGIITRPLLSREKHKMFGVYSDFEKVISKYGGIPIGILPTNKNWQEILLNCDGLIFQGGDDSEEYEKEFLKYAYEQNIPTLGICLGMQLMGLVFDGDLTRKKKHKYKNKKYVHNVFIKKDSKLFSLINQSNILVNSRHKFVINNTSLDVVAQTADGVIEAVEDKTKKFFIGVQWHPESMIAYDKVSNRLFDQFVKECEK